MTANRRMLRHTISISRHSQGEGMVRSLQEVATGVPALVMPAEPDSTTEYGISVGQGYKIYYNSDVVVKVTDKIVDNQGRNFMVRGVREYDDFGRMNHRVAFCEMTGKTAVSSEESS